MLHIPEVYSIIFYYWIFMYSSHCL